MVLQYKTLIPYRRLSRIASLFDGKDTFAGWADIFRDFFLAEKLTHVRYSIVLGKRNLSKKVVLPFLFPCLWLGYRTPSYHHIVRVTHKTQSTQFRWWLYQMTGESRTSQVRVHTIRSKQRVSKNKNKAWSRWMSTVWGGKTRWLSNWRLLRANTVSLVG